MIQSRVATITSKRQLTIPSVIFRQAKLKEGQKVRVVHDHGKIYLEPMMELIEKLAGSVSAPARFRSLTLDQMISKAKKNRFGRS